MYLIGKSNSKQLYLNVALLMLNAVRAKEVVEDEWLGPLIEQIMNMSAKETKSDDDEDFFKDQSSTSTNTNNDNSK